MKYRFLRGLFGLGVILMGVLTGCAQPQPQAPPSPPPVIPVSQPITREVTEFVDFTGRTAAVESVDIRARVTGYLVKTLFKDGAEVKKGDLLYEIDPRPYQAQLDQAISQVKLYEAQLTLAKTTYARDRATNAASAGSVSPQQLDQDSAAVEEATARLKAFQASTEVYKLNLAFTKVISPMDGVASRSYLSPGNLINQDQTLLTTIVSLDPMNVYFDMDEPTLLRIRRAVQQGKIETPKNGVLPVLMGVQGEDGYPYQGEISFVNNQVNSTTGSISVRGTFPNPKPMKGPRLLSPGMFVRVRLPIGQPYSAMLIPDRSLGSDQGLKFVYVVDADNKVQYRRVKTGPLENDGLRVIEGGLKKDEWVVVGGLQQVRPRLEVKPDRVPMPILKSSPSDVEPPIKGKSPGKQSETGEPKKRGDQ